MTNTGAPATKRSRSETLYITQFVLIGILVVFLVLTYFGLPAILVAGAAGAITVVSFARGRLEKNYLSFAVSLPLFISSVTLAVADILGW